MKWAIVTTVWALSLVGTAEPPAVATNTLTAAEKQAGWMLMFDGKTTDGWRRLGFDKFPEVEWVVRDGMLVHEPIKGGQGEDIIFDKPFASFEMSWEWRVPKANGNSGVKYRVQETKGKNGAYGPEYQMMNDPGATDKHATSSLYDVLPPSGNKLAPDGEFNQSRIIVRGEQVEHWLNGVKTLEFTFWTDAFNEAYGASKFKKKSDPWGKKALGYIALTDHGDETHFRNMKIRELKGE